MTGEELPKVRRIVRPPRDDADGGTEDARSESERHGWGDDPNDVDGGRRSRDWYERERPPHHG